MKRTLRTSQVRFSALAGALIALLWVGQVHASEIQISPAFIDLPAQAGDVIEYPITVRNIGEDAVRIDTEINDFYYNEEGNKIFVESLDKAAGMENFSIREWVTIDAAEETILQPSESTQVNVIVAIPENAEPGGHYGAIFFGMLPPDADPSGSNIAVSGRVGSLVLIDVDGFIVRGAEVTSFQAGDLIGPSGGQEFAPMNSFESGPVSFEVNYLNKGSVHYFPEGKITVEGGYQHQSWEIPMQSAVEGEGMRVFPKVAKKFHLTLNERKLFGKYTATLSAKDGDGKEIGGQMIEFWVMPIKTVLLWALMVVVGVVLLVVLVKRYNKWILSKPRR